MRKMIRFHWPRQAASPASAPPLPWPAPLAWRRCCANRQEPPSAAAGLPQNKLKRVFYQSAFCSLADPLSRAFYERKRREGMVVDLGEAGDERFEFCSAPGRRTGLIW